MPCVGGGIDLDLGSKAWRELPGSSTDVVARAKVLDQLQLEIRRGPDRQVDIDAWQRDVFFEAIARAMWFAGRAAIVTENAARMRLMAPIDLNGEFESARC
jgi:hypothetical protein